MPNCFLTHAMILYSSLNVFYREFVGPKNETPTSGLCSYCRSFIHGGQCPNCGASSMYDAPRFPDKFTLLDEHERAGSQAKIIIESRPDDLTRSIDDYDDTILRPSLKALAQKIRMEVGPPSVLKEIVFGMPPLSPHREDGVETRRVHDKDIGMALLCTTAKDYRNDKLLYAIEVHYGVRHKRERPYDVSISRVA
jgi:hypothetical protein